MNEWPKDIIFPSTAKLAKEKKFELYGYGYYTHYLTTKVDEQDGTSGPFGWKKDECTYDSSYFGNNWNESDYSNETWVCYAAPTQAILAKWLREEHGVHILIIPTVTADWTHKTIKVLSKLDNDVINGIKKVSDLPPYKEVCGEDFSTYELALEDALKEVLNTINIK